MKALGVLARIVDRLSQAMERAVAAPDTWWLAGVLIVLSALLVGWLTAPYQVELANVRSIEILDSMADNLSEEQLAAAKESSQTTTQRYMLTTVGFGLLLAAIGWVLRAGVIHFLAAAVGGQSAWPATFAMVVWSRFPDVVRNLVQSLCVIVNGSVAEHSGFSFLVAGSDWLANSKNLGYAALGQVDPFTLWHVALLAVGIVAALGIKARKAVLFSVLLTAILVLIKVLPTLLTRSLMG